MEGRKAVNLLSPPPQGNPSNRLSAISLTINGATLDNDIFGRWLGMAQWRDQAPLNKAATWPCANDKVVVGARLGLVVVFAAGRRHRMTATTRDDHGATLKRERNVAKHSSDETDLERFIAVAGFGS
ncbi:hypothetical protein SESBI_41002 [Sesbania bispinosa]|nr:hypothetical protein SESBI_41002 [Sesbania bispinosa]